MGNDRSYGRSGASREAPLPLSWPAPKFFAKRSQRSFRDTKPFELRPDREGLILPPRKRILDGAAGRFNHFVQPILELCRRLAKGLVQPAQDRPAKIFGIADDEFLRQFDHARANPWPPQSRRQDVIDQPARVGNKGSPGAGSDPIGILAEFKQVMFGSGP